MASTAATAALTESHRLAQARIGAETVRQMLAIWPLLDPSAVDETMTTWLRAAAPIVQSQRQASAYLAANYVTTFRSLELGLDQVAVQPVLAAPADPAALVTSLTVTGPWKLKAAQPQELAKVIDISRASSARAAMRHSLNGGRDTVLHTAAADDNAVGWQRVTSAKPCAFCAMLASRGPVYRSEHSAQFHPHDGCHCAAEPVYSTDSSWAPGARDLHELWNRSTTGLDGRSAQNAFRQALAAA